MAAFYSPKEVAATLGIQESTLRKYLLRLEARGYEVQRNDQGHRFFQEQDVLALRKLLSFKDEKGMTLDESADAVMLWKNGGEVDDAAAAQETEEEEAALPAFPVGVQMMERMGAFMEAQERELVSLREEMAAMRELMERMYEEKVEEEEPEQLPEPEPEPKKKGWFGWLKRK